MKYKHIQVQLVMAFFLVMIPATMFGQYIDGEFTITISSTDYSPEKKDHKDMTTSTTVIQGQVNGKIFRDRVNRYIKNPESRITECNPSTNCPVFTCTSDNSVLRANYSSTPALKEYPLFVKKTSTSNGYKFVNINSSSQEKYVQTFRFTASGENSVDKLNLNIIAYIAPSDQLAPLVPSYELRLDFGTPMYKLRDRAFGEGEWLRWDDIKEKLVPVNEPLPIGVLVKVDPSRKMEDEIYEPLLIKNYKEFDEFMLDPAEKVFLIQASGKRYHKSDYSENESRIDVVIKLAPMGFMRKPQIALSGCSELGVGEKGQVTAKADKEGGTYSFRVEPEGMFTVESSGATATLSGSSPGRGTLYVEYTSADGKKAESSQVAACVQVESYNSGQKIPQIAFFDVNGKKLEGILKVPVQTKPNEATDLLRFVPADPGVLTAVGLGDVIALQGIRPGKTTIQATTNCGATTGPAVDVEVVNCDDETIARLEKMEKAAEENLRTAINELLNAIGSPEFQKARNEFLSSFHQMMLKIGLTIISNGKAPTKAINTAAEIADNGAALSEIISSSNPQELSNNVGKQAAGKSFENIVETTYGKAVSDAYGKSFSAVLALDEVSNAAQKVCDNASEWALSSQMIEELKKKAEKANSEYDFVKSRQKLCSKKQAKTNNDDIPLADLKPIPQEQAPNQNPTPKTEQPSVQEQQNDQPAPDDEILIDPEKPPIPSTKVGLPYEPGDCGCDSTKNITVTAKDFSTLGAGMKNLGECVENFKSISLTDYQDALQDLSTLTGSMSNLLKTDAAAFLIKAKESKPQLDTLVKRVKSYDEAGNAFLNKMEKCPESLTIGMEIFQSVEKITVDSIKTKY